eukprot:7402599-Lingulodinium_polyedra.AAC.1
MEGVSPVARAGDTTRARGCNALRLGCENALTARCSWAFHNTGALYLFVWLLPLKLIFLVGGLSRARVGLLSPHCS